MKRSKFFLGLTATLLAVAGIAATKHYGTSVKRWYVTYGGICSTIAKNCENTGTNICKYAYTYAVNGIHFNGSSATFTKGGASGGSFVQANGTTVCVTTVKYTNEQ